MPRHLGGDAANVGQAERHQRAMTDGAFAVGEGGRAGVGEAWAQEGVVGAGQDRRSGGDEGGVVAGLAAKAGIDQQVTTMLAVGEVVDHDDPQSRLRERRFDGRVTGVVVDHHGVGAKTLGGGQELAALDTLHAPGTEAVQRSRAFCIEGDAADGPARDERVRQGEAAQGVAAADRGREGGKEEDAWSAHPRP